mmetsp:Transcript_16021/g.32018  ORF Transcript_16021/g.32018 Transcript_16021/m.32018 type:complete len:554 (-) Transcript_16021:265-1926(-)
MPSPSGKVGGSTKEGGKGKGPVVVDDAADSMVAALVAAMPDKRPAEATKLRGMLFEPGGVVIVWDQLCRTRKNVGPQAGLLCLVEMLNARQDKYQMAGHEPAVQCLATFCNWKEYVVVIGKVKKVMHGVMNILSDPNQSLKAKESASWVLRRTTEFCRQVRVDLGGDRETLQMLAKLLRGGEDYPTGSTPQEPATPSHAARSRAQSAESSRVALRTLPPPETGIRAATSEGSRVTSNEGYRARTMSVESSKKVGVSLVSQVSKALSNEVHADDDRSPFAATFGDSPSATPTAGGAKPSISPLVSRPQSREGSNISRPVSREAPKVLSQQSQDPTVSRRSTGLLPPPQYNSSDTSSDLSNILMSTEPLKLKTQGSFRPGTTFKDSQVITFTSEPDRQCIEGNCCAALGNTCYCDEVLERLGKTEGVMLGVVHLLENGTDWARSHAGRTLGNLAYIPENCKHLVSVDSRNVAVKSLCSILAADASPRCKEWALHAIANLSRMPNLCSSFNRVEGLFAVMQELSQQGLDREKIDRAIANLSQARLGTRTWRLPKKV